MFAELMQQDILTMALVFMAAIVAIPLVLGVVFDVITSMPRLLWSLYQGYFSRLSERETALARAAMGAFVLYVAYRLDFDLAHLVLATDDLRFWSALLMLLLLIWGSVWLMVGSGWRSRGDRNGALIFGYLVKITLGIVLVEVDPPYPWLAAPMQWVAAWCIITGAVKLFLVLRGMPKEKIKPPPDFDDDAPGHGNAGFTVIVGGRR